MKQKAKLFWMDVGDGNNRVFHNTAKIRETRNAIHEIQCSDGRLVKTKEEIKEEAVSFFESFMSEQPQEFEGSTVERLRELLGFKCSEADCEKMVKEVSKEKIKGVLFKMSGSKAPGPDGYTTEFFKESWAVVGDDITVAVQSFFVKGFLPKRLNSTILALIPKKQEANVMKDTGLFPVVMSCTN